jgi:PAS domain S-box-containing protein
MAESKRIALLVGVMMAVVIAATATSIGVGYRTAFERERQHLIANVGSHARIMEAMARFEASAHHPERQDLGSAALSQIVDAHTRHEATGDTAELTIGRLDGDQIEFLMRHRHAESGPPDPVPLTSGLAEPMARALAGESGSMVGLDYHGQRVLAAFEPVAGLNLGVVAKVDLAEIRAPFLRAGMTIVGATLALTAVGTLIFIRVTNPMISTLREREEQLALLLASTGEGIFGMDTAGRCTFANRSALRQLGYADPRALLGKDMHELIHHTRSDGQPHPREDCPILESLREETAVYRDEETLWRADGTGFPAEYRAQPMRRNGEVVGMVATFVDITERKRRELQLLQAQKMEVLGQLTGGIAHDFNNLLTVILGNLRLLAEEERHAEDPGLAELVDDALSAAADGAELTQRLLAFARKQTLAPTRIDLNAFVRDCAGIIGRLTGDDVTLILELASEPLPVLVDGARLHGALLNLAVNARDAMPEGGRLTIGTRRARGGDDANAVLTVTDSGTGMAPEVAERATEPFFTTKPRGKGSGLGLSMVYGFARQSGGEVVIRSRPGAGATIAISLPLAEATAVAAPGPAFDTVHATSVQPATDPIVVVEDEPRLRAFIGRCLTELGYEPLLLPDAGAAQTALESREGRVSLLLTDIVMPGEMDGLALARRARRRWPHLPILLTTGYSREHEAGDAEDTFTVLPKPFSKEELAAALRRILPAPAGDAEPRTRNASGTAA